MAQRRHALTDFEWSIIAPLLPNKPRGAPRADDRRGLNGIFERLRTASPSADRSGRHGPCTLCCNRVVRCARLGVRDRKLETVSAACKGSEQSVDSSSIRVQQHGSNAKSGAKGPPAPPGWLTVEPSAWGARGGG